MNLYQLTAEFQAALDALETVEETGEVIGWEAVEALDLAVEKKLEGYALAVKNYRSEAEAIGAEIKALQARKKTADTKADRLTDYAAAAMEMLGKDKLSTPRAALSFRRSESVTITDPQMLSEEYKRYKPAEPDKPAIKRAIKSGITVPGAELVEKRNLQIK